MNENISAETTEESSADPNNLWNTMAGLLETTSDSEKVIGNFATESCGRSILKKEER